MSDTKNQSAKRNAPKNMHSILTEKVIELLKNGIVPWQVSWVEAGLPENVVSGHLYRGVNRMLLASLGYKRNLFLTSNQLKELDGAILPDERPHLVFYYSDNKRDGVPVDVPSESPDTKKSRQLKYYTVFNIAQCKWSEGISFPDVKVEIEPIQVLVTIKNKDQKRAYYDPLVDVINMPAEKNYESKAAYCHDEFHQLIHSTGHYSRLNRKELIQMSEFGYDAFSHEELVAEIGTAYLMFHHNMMPVIEPSKEYIAGWIRKFEQDPYMLYSAYQQAEKAINFLFVGEVAKVND